MNRYILYLAIFLSIGLFSCSKNDVSSETELKTTALLSPEITITSVEDGQQIPLSEVFENGVITLNSGTKYHILVKFSSEVSLEKGEFLKFKSYNHTEYFADFYGTNNNPISEKVTFFKEGYQPYTLQVNQGAVIAENIYQISPIGIHHKISIGENIARLGEDKKTISLIRGMTPTMAMFYGQDILDIKMVVSFLSGVIIDTEGIGSNVAITPSKNPRDWSFTVSMASDLATNPNASVSVPVYQNIKGEKGEKLFDITLKGDFAPYISNYSQGYTNGSTTKPFNTIKLLNEQTSLEVSFKIHAEDTIAFIDNINSDLISNSQFVDSRGQYDPAHYNLTLTSNGIQSISSNRVHLFDVWEGEKDSSGQVIKKANAQKREIFIVR